uniref:F-box domain-containing protein n=1 Tax=Setaria italica TaxID=4555 RepID=K3ZNZ4_SETIT
MEVLIDIAGHVAVTSLQPMDDLHNLRAVCRVMHRVCGDPSIGRRMALITMYWEDMQWNEPDRYHALLALLVGVGNPEACTIKGIVDFFAVPKPSLHKLSRAAAGGHDVGAYPASGSAGPNKLRNDGYRVCHKEATYLVNRVTWHGHGDPLPPAPVRGDFPCVGGDCGKVKGWEQATLFYNEECRIRHEIVAFGRIMGIDN